MIRKRIYLEVEVLEPEPSDERIEKEIERKLIGGVGDCIMLVHKAKCLDDKKTSMNE